MRALVLLAAVALLAGCTAPAASPQDEAEGPASAPPSMTGNVSAPAGAPASNATSADATIAPASTSGATPLAIDGHTGRAVCVMTPTPAAACEALSDGENTWLPLADLGVAGRPTRLVATLTWEATSPLTAELRVFLFATTAEGPQQLDVQAGASPLALDWDLAALGGDNVTLSIHPAFEQGTDALHVVVDDEQPFHLEGSVAWVVP
jgi:hypothetical protein